MSTLRVNTLANQGGTQSTAIENAINGSAKAWVNFNGTGTVAIRASYNVSSITDNNTGNYTVNFTTALPDSNYCVVGVGVSASATLITSNIALLGTVAAGATTKTTTACNILNAGAGSAVDSAEQNVSVFR